jgi:hypothetical protein
LKSELTDLKRIEWGKGSAFNMGRAGGVRVERNRSPDGKAWTFLVADDERTYLHVDNRWFHTVEELNTAIILWLQHRSK